MLKKITFLCGLFFSIGKLYSQGLYSNDFLEIGVGASALAMGNSVVASVDDITAGYWNPAGLMGIKSNIEVTFMHDEYDGGIAQHDYLAISYKYDSSNVFGLSVIRFGLDNIQYTIDLINGTSNENFINNINPYSDEQYAILFSYARSFKKTPGLTLGGNIKIIRSELGNIASSWGVGLDAGIQYKYKNWLFGAVGKDITSTFNIWNYNLNQELTNIYAETGNQIPANGLEITRPSIQMGAAHTYTTLHEKVSIMPELGADITFDGERNTLINTNLVCIDPHLGVQVGYKDFAFLRLGIGNIQTYSNPAGQTATYFSPDFGVGLKIKVFTLDYALTDNTIAGLYSNIFSVKFDINKKKTK